MSLNLIAVENAKTPDEEFVILKVTARVNLKNYAIVDRTFVIGEKVSNEFRHVFFFPDLIVEKDDAIFLCTGIGKYDKAIDNNSTIHLFYWQSDKCVWNDNGNDRASLIRFTPIKTVDVPAVEDK